MKKITIILLSIVLNMGCIYAKEATIISDSNPEKVEVVEIVDLGKPYFLNPSNSLGDLEKNSKLIVKAKVLPEHENVRTMTLGYTKTKVQVTEVYSGNIKVDDIITIGEEYFHYKHPETGGMYIFALNQYEPCVDGKEYMFFLSDSSREENMYIIYNITDGRFPVLQEKTKEAASTLKLNLENTQELTITDKISEKQEQIKNMTNQELNLNEGDITHYKELFNEVVEKYN